jgi:hypothetical protein
MSQIPTVAPVNAGLGPPAVAPVQQGRPAPPDFVQIPQVDPNVTAQRQSVAQEIQATTNDLNNTRNPVAARNIKSRLDTLNHVYNGLAATEHQQNTAATLATKQNTTMQKQWVTNQDTQGANAAYKNLSTLEHGSDEKRDAIWKINQDFPNSDSETKKLLLEEAISNRQAANDKAIADRVQGKSGQVPQGAQSRYIKLQADIQQHMDQSAAEAKANKTPDVPYSKAPALHADQMEKTLLEQRYPGLNPQQPNQAAQPNQESKGYQVGTQYGNLRYKGGDPSQRASWDVVK